MYRNIAKPSSTKVLIALKTFVCLQLVLGIRTGSIDEEVVNIWILDKWHEFCDTRARTKCVRIVEVFSYTI